VICKIVTGKNKVKTMKKSIQLHFIIIILLSIPLQMIGRNKPVNTNATKEVCLLLDFLYSIQGEYTLSGQHNFISDLKRYENAVKQVTGLTPVVWGSDFSFNITGDSAKNYQHCGPMNLTVPFDPCSYNNLSTEELQSGMISEAIDQYHKGRIITLMWHACFPSYGDTCDGSNIWTGDNRISEKSWQELTTSGTNLNNQWKQQADHIAYYLKQLQECHIPVLWRPYHEMNGGWFWWGGHPGENGYKKLWIMMYNYFTHEHGLNNLVWVWNANAIGPWVPHYKDFFPGIEYVDILATDVYRREYTQETYVELQSLAQGKIVSLGEIGEMPFYEQYDTQPYTWFMSWGYYIDQYNDPQDVTAIYMHPRTITLDKMDFTDKTYKLK